MQSSENKMALTLHFRKYGGGTPLLVLHGLFGLADNWQTFAKQMAESGFAVYALDLRNHGSSPHTDEFNYRLMASDVMQFMQEQQLNSASVLGHSMGGKTAMQFALSYPDMTDKLIVVDIAPRYYPPHHQTILKALNAVDLDTVNTRSEADKILAGYIDDLGTRQFLLKNLFWKGDKLCWRFNLHSLNNHIESVGEEIEADTTADMPSLFIKGEKSNYIQQDDYQDILRLFPHASFATAPSAGHWVHADNPQWIFETVKNFLQNSTSG